MRSLSFAFLAALAISVAVSACFDKPKPECTFLCGTNDACPDGYSCRSDGWCKRSDVADDYACSSPPAVDAAVSIDGASADAGADAAPADAAPDAAPGTPDAMPTPDAATPDAAIPDAATPDAAIPDAAPTADAAPAPDAV